MGDVELMTLMRAIVVGDAAAARLIAASPDLARARLAAGAARNGAGSCFFDAITHYVYAGDTALHVAAAAYRPGIAQALIACGADVGAVNRRGATPLHYAADGVPGSPAFDPAAQAGVIACLIAAGADPNAATADGVTPLHRAVRTRCAGAVAALLEGGADPRRRTGRGTTPADLATRTTGRGGSGSAAAKAEQADILRLFDRLAL
jgi:hypothetical protein